MDDQTTNQILYRIHRDHRERFLKATTIPSMARKLTMAASKVP